MRRGRFWMLSAVPIALAACTPDYPMDKPGTWNIPPGTVSANDANLRTMISDPHDLIEGQAADGATGSEAAAPVTRLVTGRRSRLPDVNGAPLESGSGSAGDQGSATPTGAGSNGSGQQ